MITINRIIAKGSTFFTDIDGNTYACGNNRFGQLGLKSTGLVTKLQKLEYIGLKNIYSGEHHTIFLLQDGTALACGNNQYGQLGVGDKEDRLEPTKVLLDDITDVTFAGCYTIFRQSSGSYSITGSSPKNNYIRNSPVKDSNLSIIIEDDFNSFIRTKDNPVNGVYITGKNTYGELGNMTTDPQLLFTKMPDYEGMENIKKIAVGGEHVVYLTEEGSVFTVGSNDKYQLGYKSPRDRMSTPSILNLNNIVDMAAGYEHTLVLDDKGVLYGFGSNQDGQLGVGNREFVELPTKIMDEVMKIYCGEFNTFIVKTNGSILVSGYNKQGNLGLGYTGECKYFTLLEDFKFDTTLEEVKLPNDVEVEYEKGHINHTISIIYLHLGKGYIRTEGYIYTPSTESKRKFTSDIVSHFTTETINNMNIILAELADKMIRKGKEYIDDHTTFHREAVYKTKTIIRFNNGSELEVEGRLTETECKEVASQYIKEKYKIETDKIQYYNPNDFRYAKVEGDPTWKPSKGAKILVLTELDQDNYNYY